MVYLDLKINQNKQDKQLVYNLLKKEKKSIRIFYQTFKPKLLKFILIKVNNLKDAEEILQDTFISSLDSLPLFNFKSSLFTWLCSIAYHEIVDFYRKKKIKSIVFSRFPFLKKIVDEALSPELSYQEKEMKEKILKTFKDINEGYAKILRLKYIEGLALVEIAKRIGKTAKAAESQLFRARTAFRKEYAKEFSIANFQFSILEKSKQIFISSFD